MRAAWRQARGGGAVQGWAVGYLRSRGVKGAANAGGLWSSRQEHAGGGIGLAQAQCWMGFPACRSSASHPGPTIRPVPARPGTLPAVHAALSLCTLPTCFCPSDTLFCLKNSGGTNTVLGSYLHGSKQAGRQGIGRECGGAQLATGSSRTGVQASQSNLHAWWPNRGADCFAVPASLTAQSGSCCHPEKHPASCGGHRQTPPPS